MKTGDIIITRGNDIISKAIQQWTHSYWSHCAIALGGTVYIEATWPRVKLSLVGELDNVEHIIMEHVILLDEEEQEKLKEFCFSKVGKSYDWRGLFSFILGRNVQNKSWYFCSELVKTACEAANRPLLRRKAYWTTPDDIYSSLMLKEAQG